jgi:hypothetical protein
MYFFNQNDLITSMRARPKAGSSPPDAGLSVSRGAYRGNLLTRNRHYSRVQRGPKRGGPLLIGEVTLYLSRGGLIYPEAGLSLSLGELYWGVSQKEPHPPRNLQLAYRGTSLTRKRAPLGPYRRPMPWVVGGS